MVRTQPPVMPLQLDVSRVLGWSTALALHALALMLLLIPAAYVAAPAQRDRMSVRWMPPTPTPPLPPPKIVTVDPAPPKTAPAVPTQRVAPPQAPPTASADDTLAVPPLPASEPALPTLEPSTPVSGGPPALGVQLQYRSAPPPAYPIQAIRDGQQGTVLLRVRVGTDGRPSEVTIERSSGSRTLDSAARQQVLRHWRFVPAMRDGQAVVADGLVPVDFSLPR